MFLDRLAKRFSLSGPWTREAVLALLFVVLSFPASAWNEPDGFRGVPWGGGEFPIRQDRGWRFCEDYTYRLNLVFGDRRCVQEIEIDRIPVHVSFYLRTGVGLQWVELRFDPKHFDRIRSIFTTDYGPPHRSETEQITPYVGLPMTNEILIWSGQKAAIMLRKYSRSIAHGGAFLWTVQALDQQLKDLKQMLGDR